MGKGGPEEKRTGKKMAQQIERERKENQNRWDEKEVKEKGEAVRRQRTREEEVLVKIPEERKGQHWEKERKK